MNPFKGFVAVCRKEIIHMQRDRGTIFFALMMPVLQLILLGFAVDTNVRALRTVVLDQALTQESRLMIDRFAASDVFQIEGYVTSREEMYDAIVAGRAKVGVFIPPDYSRRLQEGRTGNVLVLVDGSESTATAIAVNTASTLLLQESLRRGKVEVLAAEVRPSVLFNPSTRSANFFVPGLISILLQMMVIVLTALSIVREKERGTLDQLVMTPVGSLGLMLGKMVPYGVLGFVGASWILILMRVVFQVPVKGSVLLLLLFTLPFLLTVLGLGLMISTRANSQAEAFQMAFGTILPSIFLSGYIFSIETMPVGFQWLSRIVPARYFIEILRGIILRGAGFEHLWPQAAVLLLMGVLITLAAARRFQKRLG